MNVSRVSRVTCLDSVHKVREGPREHKSREVIFWLTEKTADASASHLTEMKP